LFTRGDGSSSSTIAAAGVPQPNANGNTSTSDTINVFGSDTPIFIDGPSTPPKPAVIQIVVPQVDPSTFKDGDAVYQSVVGNQPDSCDAPNAPFNATLTITNRNNGRAITCVNRAPTGLTPGIELVLPTPLFTQIGQIVDSPIPVRISWGAG